MLVVMSGLPGSGKSSVADALGARLPAVVLSVDPIEAAIVRSGIPQSYETGVAAYEVAAALAVDQLSLGIDVIADAANLEREGQDVWRGVAERTGAPLRVIEVVCRDQLEHRRRFEARRRRLHGFTEPGWDEVVRRRAAAAPWSGEHLVLDSMAAPESNLTTALAYIRP